MNLNAFVERAVQTYEHEYLDQFIVIVIGPKQLKVIGREFQAWYNTKRSHMERDHSPPIREEPDEVTTVSIDQIEVRRYVGGLIKSFERKVA